MALAGRFTTFRSLFFVCTATIVLGATGAKKEGLKMPVTLCHNS
jgi:hypothetical protein